MRRIVLVRHGQSAWNSERRIQGQLGSGLSDLGRRQAEVTAGWMAATHPDAVVWSSDLERCRETAAPIATALGVGVVEDVQLRERDFGSWAGELVEELRERDADRFTRWAAGEDVVPEVGGESSEDVATRATAAFDRVLAGIPADGVAVVVTHGGVVWHGTHAWLGLPHGSLGGVGNCAVSDLVVVDGRRLLDAWNQTGHLPADLLTFRRVVARSAAPPPAGR